MAGGSCLQRLSDEDLEILRHRIRRDAETDLEIAKWAEGRRLKLPKSDAAKAMVIARYRASAAYRSWLKRWEEGDAELRGRLEIQRQRYEFLRDLVRDSGHGIETVGKALQARLLTLAAETGDDELKAGSGLGGWVKNVLRLVQEQARLEKQTAAAQAAEVAGDSRLSTAEKQRRIKEIFA